MDPALANAMSPAMLESTLTCPGCGATSAESMPTQEKDCCA
jgi:hypothetical protein